MNLPKEPSLIIILAAVVVIALFTIFFFKPQPAYDQITQVPQAVSNLSGEKGMMVAVAPLVAENNSGESGNVYWNEKAGKVAVTIELMNAPNNTPQPAHLHNGTCDKPGDIKYPLNPVVNGKSETTLTISEAELKKELPLIANVHKSQTQTTVYVACGIVTANASLIEETDVLKLIKEATTPGY